MIFYIERLEGEVAMSQGPMHPLRSYLVHFEARNGSLLERMQSDSVDSFTQVGATVLDFMRL